MKQFGISSQQRVRDTRDYVQIYDYQQKAWDRSLLIFAMPNNNEVTRFGLSVSKRHGNAVVRARLKRLLREAFRLEQHELPGGLDMVLIPQKNSQATIDDYRHSIVKLTHKLHRRFAKENIDQKRTLIKREH